MSEDKITIEVDGKTLEAQRGQMLIEVTDANDIYIPRFCYHPKLSVAANCRMCLVEVEKAPKPLPACATPVNEGMVVKTQSASALESQKGVMEFLLINHPLDCPICDQGGECELQDLAMGYGRDVSRYQESKRVVKDKNIGSLVQTEMTRCIHCTRCIRFGEEIAGLRELGATGRGEHMQIGTYIEKSMSSELSGNIIDVCPVGALTSKPFRFSARAWEMKQGRGIAPHDCVGSNVEVHFKENEIKRVVPAENQAINEVWISDRDRFSYEALYSDDRLLHPKIKDNGQWKQASWEDALAFAASGLSKIKSDHAGEAIGALISPSATLEEMYLLQNMMRALGSNNIDHRLKQQDFRGDSNAPIFPSLGCSIEELEDMNAVFLIGSHVRYEQPMINHRLRKAALKGATMMLLDHQRIDFNYTINNEIICSASELLDQLAAITAVIYETTDTPIVKPIEKLIKSVKVDQQHKTIAEELLKADKGIVLIGSHAASHQQYSSICLLANALAGQCDIQFGYLTEGANASGAWLAGAVPHRLLSGEVSSVDGMHARQMFENNLKSYLLFHIEPENDLLSSDIAISALRQSDFVLSFSAYENSQLLDSSDVLLPMALFAENEGSFVNIEGVIQSFKKLVTASDEIKQGWKIIRALGEQLQLKGFEQNTLEEIQAELLPRVKSITADNFTTLPSSDDTSNVKAAPIEMPLMSSYDIDPMSRRAESLQIREGKY